MLKCFYVGLGGCVGSVCRYLVGLALAPISILFPVSTLLINLSGSFLIGVISELSLQTTLLHPDLTLFLTTGICGGFTTFSTFSLETSRLLEDGRTIAGIVYAAASVLLCLIGVTLGRELIRLITA